MTTGALLPLLSGCGGVQIHDEQFCSPVPGGLGAVCDNFLTSNQLILDQAAWEAMQASWDGVECTSSKTLGDIKTELEQLCSKTPCTYPQKQQLKLALKHIDKIMALSQRSRNLVVE